ncbi:type II toxin-antitoxin system HicA family toxin [Candidatus Parcubacteria bacterium]|nr:type II toxin-antitoxin system HicA family toxin [Candidatus Parcubacteria bacterium]
MPKPKVLSGQDVLKILAIFDFAIISQKGSHIKLRRDLHDGTRQTLTIPNHKELDKGTTVAIFRQALRYIPEAELKQHFYD